MPLLTPSRFGVVIIGLSLITFLWTFGLPRNLPTPVIPSSNQNHDPIVHEPAPAKPLQSPAATPIFTLDATPATEATNTPENKKEDEKENNQDGAIIPTANSTEQAETPQSTPSRPPKAQSCRDVKGASDIMVVVKTSAAEVYQKLPVHLLTLLECVPNYAIFSDHSGTIAGHKIHNALEDISEATMKEHEEFEAYKAIQQHGQEYQQLEDFKGDVSKDLDKWKFLPMVYKAYKMNPHQRFYIFIEADTSLSWTNLLQWIARLDYRIPYYSGAPTFLNSIKFAQRGSGVLLSQGALKMYAKLYEEKYSSDWEKRMGHECCGDLMLAMVLAEAHVEFYSAFPLLQGETPSSLDWTKRHWCAPVVSWHRMSTNEIDILWGFQQKWITGNGWNTPYLIRNTFQEFIEPLLTETRDEWDNLSQDMKITRPANDSPMNSEENMAWYRFTEEERNTTLSSDNCRDFCRRQEECLQWKYKKDECDLGKVIRLGRRIVQRKEKDKDKKDDETKQENWTSGWITNRIKKATGEWGECEEPSWKFNQ